MQVALRSYAGGPLALCRPVVQSGQTWAAKAYAGLAVSLGLLGTLGLAPVRAPALPCCMSPPRMRYIEQCTVRSWAVNLRSVA